MTQVSMTVNGKPASGEVEGRTLLVSFLRDQLGMTGTHVGCDTSQCGACVVHVDGKPVKSCTMLALEADGAEVATIEGQAAPDGTLSAVQQAFPGSPRSAMRVLHPGDGDERDGAAEGEPQADGTGDPWLPGGEHLPLHRLSQYRQGDHGGQRSGRDGHRGGVTGDRRGQRRAEARPTRGSRAGCHPGDNQGGISICRRTTVSAPARSGAKDVRFLSGTGNYTDDINLRGQAYVHFLRSDVAHGRINGIDTRGGGGDARRDPHLYRRGFRGRRRAALRLAGDRQAWSADAGAGASGAGPGQGAPCGRSDCRRRGREPRAGARCGGRPSSWTSRSCRRSST